MSKSPKIIPLALGLMIAIIPMVSSCTKDVSVNSVSISKTSLELMEGNSETLSATVKPDNATDKSVIWSSSDKSVATVDATGKVTAVKAGCATITVTTEDGGKTAGCSVTVSALPSPFDVHGTIDSFIVKGDAKTEMPQRQITIGEKVTLYSNSVSAIYSVTSEGSSFNLSPTGNPLVGNDGDTVYAVIPTRNVSSGCISYDTYLGDDDFFCKYQINRDRLPEDVLVGVGTVHDGSVTIRFSLLYGYFGLLIPKDISKRLGSTPKVRICFENTAAFSKGQYKLETHSFSRSTGHFLSRYLDLRNNPSDVLDNDYIIFFPITPFSTKNETIILYDAGGITPLAEFSYETLSIGSNEVFIREIKINEITTGDGNIKDTPIINW